MRDLLPSLKRLGLGAAFGVLFGMFGFGQQAQHAYPWEMNFWLSGPRYAGRVAECGRVLGTISNQFREKESKFWNSALQITGYGEIHETAFRPWQSDNIPRRYCSADVLLNDGTLHTVHYSIIEDGGFAGFGQAVEWCVTGLDRNWAYNPNCRAARPCFPERFIPPARVRPASLLLLFFKLSNHLLGSLLALAWSLRL